MEWYIGVLKKFADFSGRARRMEYWMFFLFNVIIGCGFGFIEGLVGGPGILGLIYYLIVFVPSIAVFVRRLHDTGKSALWILIGLVPVIGAIVLLVFMATEGTAGDNEYGPNPKADEA